MLTTLPQPIAAYVQATNAHDSAAFAAAFAEDAVVADDGQDHRGRAAIKAWNEHNVREYAVSMTVIETAQRDDQTILTARLSGTFDGSPLTFRYTFSCAGEFITSLYIEQIN
jgi:uncharacterized protein (TIGR02246 family)